MHVDRNTQKNRQLKSERNISFEDVLLAMEENRVIDVGPHPNQTRYPHQKVMIVNIQEYIYVVPFVVDTKKDHIFLKTIYPSRKLTKQYLLH